MQWASHASVSFVIASITGVHLGKRQGEARAIHERFTCSAFVSCVSSSISVSRWQYSKNKSKQKNIKQTKSAVRFRADTYMFNMPCFSEFLPNWCAIETLKSKSMSILKVFLVVQLVLIFMQVFCCLSFQETSRSLVRAGLVIDIRKALWLRVSVQDNTRFFLPLSTHLSSEISFGRIFYHLHMFSLHMSIDTNRANLAVKTFAGELFFIFTASVTKSENLQCLYLK